MRLWCFGNAAGSGKGGGVAHSKTRLLRLTTPLAGAVTLLLAGIVVTDAADCPRQDVLGTSRVLEVDAKAHARVGLNSFRETLPLADHEVVLTFDDGPRPPSTQRYWRRSPGMRTGHVLSGRQVLREVSRARSPNCCRGPHHRTPQLVAYDDVEDDLRTGQEGY